jgi:hypothetical protein
MGDRSIISTLWVPVLVPALTACPVMAPRCAHPLPGAESMVLSQARTPSAGTSAKLKRLVSAFEREYAEYQRTVASWEMNAVEVYHLRRGVQALVDMWRATGNRTYLRRAHDLTLRAMQAAQATPRPMHRGSTSHGEWPCFFHPDVEKVTGGHSQGSDFQGASGFPRRVDFMADPIRQDCEWATGASSQLCGYRSSFRR